MLPSWALLALGLVSPLAAQELPTAEGLEDSVGVEAATDSLVGAAVSVGSGDASLDLHLSDGRTVQLELAGGVVRADGESLGRYDEDGALERSWRSLLEGAAMASTTELPALLRQWEPPAGTGSLGDSLDRRLEEALAGVGGRMVLGQTADMPLEDSVDKLLARIESLEDRKEATWDHRSESRSAAGEFLHDVAEGLTFLFAALVWFAVMLGVGAAFIFFGEGRIERVAHTVRDEPLRSWLIGVAATFLAVPFYVLVTLALAISIIGVPLILGWAPLFPLIFVLAFIAGWVAVAYSVGERMVQRKLSARPRFENAGPMHYMGVGIALLLSPFVLAALFQMTSFLEPIGALLFGLGIFANVLLSAMGFGAVLSRGAGAWERRRDRRAAEKRALAERTAQTQENTNV